MTANKINMKQTSEDLKSFHSKEIENNAKKRTEKIIENMSTKFDKLSTRIETINRKAEAANHYPNKIISKLLRKSSVLQEKLVEQMKKICDFDENIEDKVNKNYRDTLVIRQVKKENQEKTWNNTSCVLCSSFCGLFGWNENQFLSDIERAHSGNYKNPNPPTYVKFILWNISQTVLDSIIRANISRQTNTSASQKYFHKVQK